MGSLEGKVLVNDYGQAVWQLVMCLYQGVTWFEVVYFVVDYCCDRYLWVDGAIEAIEEWSVHLVVANSVILQFSTSCSL